MMPVSVAAPVPPCATLRGVERADRLVMSLFAPDFAAERLLRAVAASVPPVPPLATGSVPLTCVVRPTLP